MPGRPANAGYTLVELLVAITILLVTVTGVYTSFSLGVRVRQDCRARAEQLQTARQLTALLANDLRNLAPTSPNLAVAESGISLLRRRRIPSPVNAADPDSLFEHIAYRLDPDDELALLLRSARFLRLDDVAQLDLMDVLETADAKNSPRAAATADSANSREWRFRGITAFNVSPFTWEGEDVVEGDTGIQSDPAKLELAFGPAASDSATASLEGETPELQTATIWIPRVRAQIRAGEERPES